MRKLTVGSLFAGIGGFDLGLERTGGFEVRFQVEIDDYCRAVLEKHWPNVKRYADIRAVESVERVDVLCGGFPCQPVSVAGKQLRQADDRWLWPEFCRLIRLLRPRYALIENVPGLFNGGMGDVLRDLAEMRFDAEWHVISAEDVGAPHLRERVWILAYSNARSDDRRLQFQSSREMEPVFAVADSQGERRREAREHQPRRQAERISSGVFPSSNPRRERVQGICQGPIPRFREFSWCQDVRRAEDLFGRSDIPEPLFRGSRDGVPNWVDRTHALGNAIVPQIATWIGERILEQERSNGSLS